MATEKKLTEMLAIRLAPEQSAKLSRLAETTGRSKGGVLRELLARAETSGAPDLVLRARETKSVTE